MSDKWYVPFCTALEERAGIAMRPSARGRLEHVLRLRAGAAADVAAYVDWLVVDAGAEEWQRLVNALTVGKTSFYRYPQQVSLIVDDLIPVLDRTLADGAPIHVWSAACSTGEEPYTLLMALDDAGWLERRDISVLGTDINTDALTVAEQGVYEIDRPASLPVFIHERLKAEGGRFHVPRRIREHLRLCPLNLVEREYPQVGWHVIVCANVLIYFNADTKRRILDAFEEVMAPRSALLLGASESLHPYRTTFALASFGDSFAYLKGSWHGELPRCDAILGGPDASATPTPLRPTAHHRPRSVSRTQHPTRHRRHSSRRPARAGAKRAAAPALTRAMPPPVGPAPAPGPVGCTGLSPLVESSLRDAAPAGPLRREESNDHPATSDVGSPGTPRDQALRALASGDLEQSCFALEGAVAADPLAYDLAFYLGWVYLSLQRVGPAMQSFRRSLMLEPTFALGRYAYALTLHHDGDYDRAVREYSRALDQSRRASTHELAWGRVNGIETFWIDGGWLSALSQANRERARHYLPPLAAGADTGVAS